MLPTFMLWDRFPINLYGLLNFLALNLGLVLLIFRVRAQKLNLNMYLNLGLIVLTAGLVGGRLVSILTKSPIQNSSSQEELSLLEGGFSFLGAFAAGTVSFVIFLWWKGLSIWATADVVAPLLPFSQAVSKLGCFFAGCCHGIVSTLGIPFHSENIELEFRGQLLFPVQLLESLGYLLLGVTLLFLAKKYKSKIGLVTIAYVFLYAFIRFNTDFLRWYPVKFYQLSISQILCICLMVGAIFCFTARIRQGWSGNTCL